jgi:phosphoserine phosphatase RsbU/P
LNAIRDAHHLLQSMPCACVSFDDAGKVEFVNAFLCETLEYEPEELVGQSVERILTISSRLFYQTHFFPLLRLNGKVSEIFLTLRSKSGKGIPVMANGTRQQTEDHIGNLFVCFPVWERQKYENELLQSKKALQKTLEDNETLQMLRNELEQHQRKLDLQIAVLIQRNQEYIQLNKVLSHDLQEPIRKIGIYTDILLNDEAISHDHKSKAYARKVGKLVERLRNLTDCLQPFVDVEANEEELVSVELEKLLERARVEAALTTDFDDFSFEVGRLPLMEVRVKQMILLFTELIKNCIQNRQEQKRLMIRVSASVVEENSYHFTKEKYYYTDHVRLEITDNGMGLDNRYSTYVLGVFNKLNPESQGMGMGLALCKQIVSNHYGTISIRSEEGKGCTVIITLPIKKPSNSPIM